jgi:hypothetical protein
MAGSLSHKVQLKGEQVQEAWSLIWGMEGALGLRLWERVEIKYSRN